MRITEIDIDRFRIWRNLLLKVRPEGLNVFYGPNEAGKTTLMRFVRSVLYGYEPMDQEPAWYRPEDGIVWRGALRCEHEGRKYRIHRTAAGDHRGRFRLSGAPRGSDKHEQLKRILTGTDESVYADVFAVGIRELQQLSTLGSHQVAEYIYGLSLGPQGRQLLDSLQEIDQRKSALLPGSGRSGRLPDLFDQYARVASRPASSGQAREEHARLTRRRQRLESGIRELRQREDRITNELRGLRYLRNCYKPWKLIRDLQQELAEIPLVQADPDEAIKQYDACVRDAKSAADRKEKLQQQAESLSRQAARLETDPDFERERYAIQSLVDQAAWLRKIDTQIHDAEERSGDLKRELHRQLTELGETWTVDRLLSVDTTPAAHHNLLQTARRYQSALQRRSKLRRMVRSLTKKSQQELVELNRDLESLGDLSIDQAIENEKLRMEDLQQLGRLRLHEEQLALKIETVRRVMSRVETDEGIPPWVDRAVNTMAIIGTLLFVFGLGTFAFGGERGASLGGSLAAAAFGFAGMMWWGVRNGLRNHFDHQTGIRLDDLNDEARRAESQLRQIRERIHRSAPMVRQLIGTPDSGGKSGTEELVELIGECSRRITYLEGLSRRQESSRKRRHRLRVLRDRFRSAQQKTVAQRAEWCRMLAELGMDETVRVQQAFDWWQRLQELRELHGQWRQAAPEAEGLRRMFRAMQQRVTQLGKGIKSAQKLDFDRPLEVLTAWQQQLSTLERDRAERIRLQTDAVEKRRDAQHTEHQLEAAELRRDAVLARNGADSRTDLEQQSRWESRRRDIDRQLDTARSDLTEASSAESDLAVVEEDLIRLDLRQAKETIQLQSMELEDVEKKLQADHEELGGIKQRLQVLESSRQSHDGHFEKSQLAREIHEAAEEWLALRIERDIVLGMRQQFEQENISGTLRTASSYMHRMTAGRYHRIWAPLGEDFLCIDDEYGRTFRVEQLSGGTREQLFLSVRFALVREFARRGTELPLVMDDLFVNFDQERTEAAVDCLMDVAAEGQQILFFTCHEHLAQLFQTREVAPLWLPGHRVYEDLHRPEDEGAAYAGGQVPSEERKFAADSDELIDEGDSPSDSETTESTRAVG